jgi:hypothetical protein
MAVYSGDNVAEIRDKAFSYTYRANVKAEIPESIIKALKVKRNAVIQNPNIERLICGTLPSEMNVQSLERATEIREILYEGGVDPLQGVAA